ncbi:MAG: hypothetical protein V1708_03670 [Candidatus Micrarchaeota archaeon]
MIKSIGLVTLLIIFVGCLSTPSQNQVQPTATPILSPFPTTISNPVPSTDKLPAGYIEQMVKWSGMPTSAALSKIGDESIPDFIPSDFRQFCATLPDTAREYKIEKIPGCVDSKAVICKDGKDSYSIFMTSFNSEASAAAYLAESKKALTSNEKKLGEEFQYPLSLGPDSYYFSRRYNFMKKQYVLSISSIFLENANKFSQRIYDKND